jgi:hypothetical protein
VAPVGQKTAAQLVELLRCERVLDMPALRSAFPGRSQRGIMRDLAAVGYRTSCNLHGRFYALADVPEFNEDGLWRHRQVLFSRQGTLKATVRHLVEAADDGRTHGELQERLRLRVHDTLLDLVQKGEIAREALDQLFLYISADLQIGNAQLRRRRAQMTPAPPPLDASTVIAVLVTVIRREARRPEDAVAHLRAEGRPVTLEQVREVFERYELGKKN